MCYNVSISIDGAITPELREESHAVLRTMRDLDPGGYARYSSNEIKLRWYRGIKKSRPWK